MMLFLISCETEKMTPETVLKNSGYKITILEYDSCEYLVVGNAYQKTITHKGNCKFCKTRKKK